MSEAGRGERGSIVFFCLMEMAIFSRSTGDRCFSLREAESILRSSGLADVGQEWVARSM